MFVRRFCARLSSLPWTTAVDDSESFFPFPSSGSTITTPSSILFIPIYTYNCILLLLLQSLAIWCSRSRWHKREIVFCAFAQCEKFSVGQNEGFAYSALVGPRRGKKKSHFKSKCRKCCFIRVQRRHILGARFTEGDDLRGSFYDGRSICNSRSSCFKSYSK